MLPKKTVRIDLLVALILEKLTLNEKLSAERFAVFSNLKKGTKIFLYQLYYKNREVWWFIKIIWNENLYKSNLLIDEVANIYLQKFSTFSEEKLFHKNKVTQGLRKQYDRNS